MDTILTLVGKTRKGKNRIRELGDQWMLACKKDKGGPWLLICPLSNQEKCRWIHLSEDEDFEVQAVKFPPEGSKPYSPFGHHDGFERISEADLAYLSGQPTSLTIKVKL